MQRRWWLGGILGLVLCGTGTSALAGDFFCTQASAVLWYQHSIDPTQTPPCPAPAVRIQISKADAPAQEALAAAVPLRHLKVVGTLMAEMTPEEKAVVDAPLLAAQAILDAFREELQYQDVCAAATVADVRGLIDAGYNQMYTALVAAIAPITDAPTPANLEEIKHALVSIAQVISEQRGFTRKLALCLVGLRKVLRR